MTIDVYTSDRCTRCRQVKKRLTANGVEFNEINMSHDDDARNKVMSMGFTEAPVVMTDDGESHSGFRIDRLDDIIKRAKAEEAHLVA